MSTAKPQFTCSLFSPLRLRRDAALFAKLWSAVAEPHVQAARYDSQERPLTRPFAADPAEPFQLLSTEQYLYVAGNRDGFSLSISYAGSGITSINIYLDAAAMDGPDGAPWLDWLFRLVGALPILFGYGCSDIEYAAKHEELKRTKSGTGFVTGWLGASMAEFQKYLPGIYWLTIFGPELGRALPFLNLESLAVAVEDLDNDQVAVKLNEPLVPADMDARLALEARVADALGATFFFDRNRQLAFEHVPAFKDALDRAKAPR